MIRIKFRGYDKMKGWVYGDLTHAQGVGKDGKLYPRIMVAGYEVDQKSVGIATGVYDVKGREVCTGDIIKVTQTIILSDCHILSVLCSTTSPRCSTDGKNSCAYAYCQTCYRSAACSLALHVTNLVLLVRS